jgi:hypothetical protein
MEFRRIPNVARLLIASLLLTLATGTVAQAASPAASPAQTAAPTAAQTQSQHPLLDMLAAKVIKKYQTTPCAQLKMQKADKEPPTAQEQKVIQFLKSDPQMRTLFINKVAAPVANRMFECGMIP